MRKIITSVLFCILPLYGMQEKPWFGDIYRFYWENSYSYSYFDKLADSVAGFRVPSNNHLVTTSIESSVSPQWNCDLELELAATPRQHFGFRSIALQARYLWADDILGDLVSCATGMSIRVASGVSLADISSPHHGNVDFQWTCAVGKEWVLSPRVIMRIWANGLVGVANRGSPWVGGVGGVAANVDDIHKAFITLRGAHGYGITTQIDVDTFAGYGGVRYRFLDIVLCYSCKCDLYGYLSVAYVRRLFAGSYPAQTNQFTVTYLFPFSF